MLKSYIYAIPLILSYQFLFLWGYTKAPNFLLIWFITTALTNSLAFILGYFLYHNHVSVWGLIGVTFILTGVVFLQIK
jgi:multidrug transporter EmrE-like cation transporter